MAPSRRATTLIPVQRFDEVLALIEAARRRAYQAINTELVDLYWELGKYISKKIASAEWGDGVVDELAATIARQYPGVRGYTRRNLFRMRQFYDTYQGNKKVSPLVTQLPWTHHLILLSQMKHPAEREFYMVAAIKERWTKRELERQIVTGAALRSDAPAKRVSPAVTQAHPTAIDEFKNAYSLEFLELREGHSEADLHGALLRNLGLHYRARTRLLLRRVRVPDPGREPGLRDRSRVLPPRPVVPRRVRAQGPQVRARIPREAELLRRGTRPRREEAPRASVDRGLAVRHQG